MRCSAAALITADCIDCPGRAVTEEGMPKEGLDAMRTAGFGWRVVVSIAVFFGWLIFLIIWLFFYADEFSVYQNLAIVIVSIMVLAGISTAAWASWGTRFFWKR
jgi:hypothetical protein